MDLREIGYEDRGKDGTGSGSCPMSDFGTSGDEPPGSVCSGCQLMLHVCVQLIIAWIPIMLNLQETTRIYRAVAMFVSVNIQIMLLTEFIHITFHVSHPTDNCHETKLKTANLFHSFPTGLLVSHNMS
jgi:hypothetical protein